MIEPSDQYSEPQEIVTRAFRAGVLGQRFIDSLGYEDVAVFNDTDGECERFMQTIPFIKGLREVRSAYGTGRALLWIGCTMDNILLDVSIATFFVERLTNAIRAFNSANETEQWSAERTIDLFGSIPVLNGDSLSGINIDEWNKLRSHLLANVGGPKGTMDDCVYTHPSLVEICNEIVPQTRSYHVSADLYSQLEGITYRVTPSLVPQNVSFVIHVDGDHWEEVNDDEQYRVRTDYLYAAFEESDGLLLERTSWKGSQLQGTKGRALGVDFNRTTGSLTWRSTENVVTKGQRVRIDPPDREKDRIFRVALGFALLLQHSNTKVTAIDGNELLRDHFVIDPPSELTIFEAILSIVRSRSGS